MVSAETEQREESLPHVLYLLGCCTVGPALGLVALVAIWIRPAFLVLATLALFALSRFFELGSLAGIAKYFLLGLALFSLLIRYVGRKIMD